MLRGPAALHDYPLGCRAAVAGPMTPQPMPQRPQVSHVIAESPVVEAEEVLVAPRGRGASKNSL
eukprot:1145206-Lingulodinium_polyedra.AAC.2